MEIVFKVDMFWPLDCLVATCRSSKIKMEITGDLKTGEEPLPKTKTSVGTTIFHISETQYLKN